MPGEFDNVVWEYKLINKPGLSHGGSPDDRYSEIVFNELGKDGWEFVAFSEFDGIFKRRAPSWSPNGIFEE